MQLHIARKLRGFSLIEVLIAVVILSVGLLALATLQIGIMRSSAEAKTQSIGLNLAQQKLEELISYRILNEATGVTCPSANDSYQCIDGSSDTLNDVGGSLGGVNYTRTWDVLRCTQASGAFTCSSSGITDPYTATNARNEFKTISVTVAWTDAAAGSKSISVVDATGSLNPSDVALLQKKSAKLVPRTARMKIYDPGLEAGVIPIAIGNGSNSAATNPKPDVVVGQNVVETRFDVLTYSGLNSGTADAQARVETAMIGCVCDFDARPNDQDPTSNPARSKRPAYWNGVRYVVPDNAAYVPPAGTANVTQSTKCSACCRDHHDSDASVAAGMPKFSPYVVTHAHYNANLANSLAVTSGQYKDSCRMIRSDGIFRVAPDLRLEYFGLLATEDLGSPNDYATTPVPDPTAATGYKEFVVDYMDARYTAGLAPSPANSYTGYNNPTGGAGALDPASLEVKLTSPVRDLNAPASIVFRSGDSKWLHSRGLFVDYLEKEVLDAIAAAKLDSDCDGSVYPLSTCVLKLLPFTTINLTELSDWNSASTLQLVVSNNNYSQSASANDPVRAQVTQGSSPGNNVDSNINSLSRKGNTGLLDLSFDAISYADSATYTDAQTFLMNGSVQQNPNGGDFFVNLTIPNLAGTPYADYVTLGSLSRDCQAGSPVTNHTCTVTNGTNSTGLTVPGTMSVIVGNYNRMSTALSRTSIASPLCTNSDNKGGAAGGYVLANNDADYEVKSCYNYEVTAATNTTTAGTSTIGTAVLPGLVGETTKIDFSLINPNDVITVTFDSPVVTQQTLVCTYTCSKSSCSTNGNQKTYSVTSADCP